LGMITGAVWTDVTGDQKEDLIVVGEWMSPRVFSFRNNSFHEVKTNLTDLHGWWQSVTAADMDGDGDKDLVMGNIGENFYLKPDLASPVKLWVNDFDANGAKETIMTRTVHEKDVPVFMKREVTDQVVSLRKQNLRHAAFAKKSIQELFDKDVLEQTYVKQFNYASSVIAFNEEGSIFTIQKLPVPVQLSSVNAIRVSDINNDGKPDLIMGGNKFGLLPQFSRLDASLGHVLLNQGNRNFQYLNTYESGIELRGEVRDIVEIKGRSKTYWLWLQNNGKPIIFHLNQGSLKEVRDIKNK
jgi:enediyne biosynthesis protein E4